MVTGEKNVGCWIGLLVRDFAKELEQNVFFGWSGLEVVWRIAVRKPFVSWRAKTWRFFNFIFWEMKFDFGG
jgi:hypothetical protein